MAAIESYGLIGDTHTAALVGRDGSIDWLCLPRFDDGACFARLLGGEENGFYRIAPVGPFRCARRRYRGDTLVLETELETDDGAVRLVDCMPIREESPTIVRLVEGLRGRVEMQVDWRLRFDYGAMLPWIRRLPGKLQAVAGPNASVLRPPFPVESRGGDVSARFTVAEGRREAFVMSWHPSWKAPPRVIDAAAAIDETEAWWTAWAARCTYEGPWREAVLRSLITLRALAYRPTGGVVAAPTTSLPERIGGVRNWDYRYCWLRDSTLTLDALLECGYHEEAHAWRDWLLRAVAGNPEQMQIMYGLAGERRLPELEIPWLHGYEGSKPVRVGNAAHQQFQLDIYGDVIDALHQAHRAGLHIEPHAWELQRELIEFVCDHWREPDHGIWEVRGRPRHFVHSKVNAWVALDRAVCAVENFEVKGPIEKWRRVRDEIHAVVCREGFDRKKDTFTQSFGDARVDASLLLLPRLGFLPPDDPRIRGTVAAVERELLRDGFVLRYAPEGSGEVDGLPEGEGAFLPCSFFLVDAWALQGRMDEARALFERLLSVRNDVGLLAEEYDAGARRLLGNFPQAFSHIALVSSALNLSGRRRFTVHGKRRSATH